MTTEEPREVKCALCRKANTVWELMSTNTMQEPDLDMRPGEMMRSTMHMWVQRCPHCGYCAPEIEEDYYQASTTAKAKSYKQQLANHEFSDLANSFLCSSLIQENGGDYAQAGRSALCAAWSCDDYGLLDQATECRYKAIELFVKAKDNKQGFAKDSDTEDLILVDLLRRIGSFKEALVICETTLNKGAARTVRGILNYQKSLMEKSDVNRHSLDDVVFEEVEGKTERLNTLLEHLGEWWYDFDLIASLDQRINELEHAIDKLNELDEESREKLLQESGIDNLLRIKHRLADTLFEQGLYEKADALYKEIFDLGYGQDTYERNKLLGGLVAAYENLEMFDEARAELERAIGLEPDTPEYHNNLGTVLADLGRMDEAREEFFEALRLMPDYAEAHFQLGIIYGYEDRLEEAIREYEEAIRINPDHVKSMNNLSNIYRARGDLEKATDLLKMALQIEADFDVALFNIADLHYEKGELSDSLAMFRRFLECVTARHYYLIEVAEDRIREIVEELSDN